MSDKTAAEMLKSAEAWLELNNLPTIYSASLAAHMCNARSNHIRSLQVELGALADDLVDTHRKLCLERDKQGKMRVSWIKYSEWAQTPLPDKPNA